MKHPEEKELSCKRSEYLKKLKITAKISHKTKDMEPLISIETYNPQKRQNIELVMRTIHDLESLSVHIISTLGGHIVPQLKPSVLTEKDLTISSKHIHDYLVALQRNKYCRQDSKYFCFLLQQKTLFPKQPSYEKALKNAAEYSRKYLNTFFTRKDSPHQSMKDLINNYASLKLKIEQFNIVKEIALIKIKEFVCFEETMGLFAELSAVPCVAVSPHQQEIENIWRLIKASDSLIEQAEQAYLRWELLIQNVRQTQNNVYKGLHQDIEQLEIKEKQLKEWNISLDIQFFDMIEYLNDKMQRISQFVYVVKRKIIDFAILTSIKDQNSEEGEVLWKKAAIQISKEEQQFIYEPPSPSKLSHKSRSESSQILQEHQIKSEIEGEKTQEELKCQE